MSPRPPFPFFVGADRSGTTLLVAMLGAHPDMAIPPESHFIVKMGKQRYKYEEEPFRTDLFLEDLGAHERFTRWDLPLEKVQARLSQAPPRDLPDAVRAVYELYAETRGKPRYGDKTPGYVRNVALLADLFPEAVFVHVIRDGRDVALSLLEVEWGPRTLPEAAFFWRSRIRDGRAAGKQLGPGRYTELRYEDLLERPEAELRRLCDFVGLEFDSSVLEHSRHAETVAAGALMPHRHANLRKPLTKGLRDWRTQMAADDQALFEAISGTVLEDLGYERSGRAIGAGDRLVARMRWMGVWGLRAAARARVFLKRR